MPKDIKNVQQTRLLRGNSLSFGFLRMISHIRLLRSSHSNVLPRIPLSISIWYRPDTQGITDASDMCLDTIATRQRVVKGNSRVETEGEA